jgi:hypothetical protein
MLSHSVCVNGETSCRDTTKLFMFSPNYLENPGHFAIRLAEQISCRPRSLCGHGNPIARRTSTTTRTIPNSEFGLNLIFGFWV